MPVERITDANYADFKASDRAVLVVSMSLCSHCYDYMPVVRSLAERMPHVRFGEAVADKGRLGKLKRDFRDMTKWGFPTTLFIQNGTYVAKTAGALPLYAVRFIANSGLLLGSTVYLPAGQESPEEQHDSAYIPARIEVMHNGDIDVPKPPEGMPYCLTLLEDSALGREGEVIRRHEGEFMWNKPKTTAAS